MCECSLSTLCSHTSDQQTAYRHSNVSSHYDFTLNDSLSNCFLEAVQGESSGYLDIPGFQGTYLTVGAFHKGPPKHGGHPLAATDQQWFVGTDGSIIQGKGHICQGRRKQNREPVLPGVSPPAFCSVDIHQAVSLPPCSRFTDPTSIHTSDTSSSHSKECTLKNCMQDHNTNSQGRKSSRKERIIILCFTFGVYTAFDTFTHTYVS